MYVCRSKNKYVMLIDGRLALRMDNYEYPPCMPEIRLFYDSFLTRDPELRFDGVSVDFHGYSTLGSDRFVSYMIISDFTQFSISQALLYRNNLARLSIFGTEKDNREIDFYRNPLAFVKKEANGDVYIKPNGVENFVFIGNFPVFEFL